jgi:hypothetical protein
MKLEILSILFFGIFFTDSGLAQRIIPYSVPPDQWKEEFGNHRAIIEVNRPHGAVSIDFLWRRHDSSPEKRRKIIVNAETGEKIKNIFRAKIDNEQCELVFGPVEKAGLYYFYYLPYTPVTNQYHSGEYLPVEGAPDSLWVIDHKLMQGPLKYKNVNKAPVIQIQARTEFHSFFPMEVIATRDELKVVLSQHANDYLVFAEDRAFPIRMPDAIPLRWIQKQRGEAFYGQAKKNEYYALQLGIYASQKPVENVRLEFSDLIGKSGNRISNSVFTCFNTDGADINGKSFSKRINVQPEKVQPLWVGTDIPADAFPDTYEGFIVIKPENLKEQKVKIVLIVENDILADRGDGELWRHSRLRWLNSTLGIDDEPVMVKSGMDWGRLNLNPWEVTITAPEIQEYQRGQIFKVDEPIPVDAKGDCLLIISKK